MNLPRNIRRTMRAPLNRAHYRALGGIFANIRDPFGFLKTYLVGGGEYPARITVRTPLGDLSPTVFAIDDLKTVNEVFARRDYAVRPDLKVAVDFGSNIGISALYFLSRNPLSFVYLFEPDARNVARLKKTLAGFEDRYALTEAAVTLEDGETEFATEPTGRYGGVVSALEKPLKNAIGSITCPTVDANRVLREVIATHGRIDMLKIDIEGLEASVIAGLAPDVLAGIAEIRAEMSEACATPARFSRSQYGSIAIFSREG